MSAVRDLVPLPGSAKRPLANARAIGPSAPDQPIEVTIVIKPPAAAQRSTALRSALAGGVAGRPFLSREEFATNFGASATDVQRVEEFAQAAGLEVRDTNPARRTVTLVGNAAQMGAAFGVDLQDYQLPDGSTYRGRSGSLKVPASLAGIVESVLGLDDRQQARPHFQLLSQLRVITRRPLVTATAFTPLQIAQLYDFPSQGNAGVPLDGRGQCIAIVELGGGYIEADLAAYFAGLGVPVPKVITVGVDGAGNQPGSDADTEVMLDIEVAGAVAPGATIAVYFAPNTSRGFYDAITTAIHDTQNRPSVLSISWGAPEGAPDWTTATMQSYNKAFQDAATLGVSICCASGDSGSSDGRTDGRPHVDFPASAPYALACGGTKLAGSGRQIASEVVWNEDPTTSATGGGVSVSFPLPSWQAKARVPAPANSRRKNGRGVPDVAGDADPATGYEIRVNGANTVVGGTSAVAPLWAGLIALFNQCLNRPVGCLNPTIYTDAYKAAFHDITSGNNGNYKAGPGWDPCTGLGSPDGTAIVNVLQGP
jgi:kumamolisin